MVNKPCVALKYSTVVVTSSGILCWVEGAFCCVSFKYLRSLLRTCDKSTPNTRYWGSVVLGLIGSEAYRLCAVNLIFNF